MSMGNGNGVPMGGGLRVPATVILTLLLFLFTIIYVVGQRDNALENLAEDVAQNRADIQANRRKIDNLSATVPFDPSRLYKRQSMEP